MIEELHIADLGVIERVNLLIGPGLTAVTGETGAGKTMIVTAIDLLVGGRADSSMVRPGADQAVVEGRFVVGSSAKAGLDDSDAGTYVVDDEVIIRRVVPSAGRSRAYVNGQLATASVLAELGTFLVDLHGQHSHQSLLDMAVQRHLLDVYGKVDLGPIVAARAELAAIEAALGDLGGDARERAREIDLYRFQVRELDDAAIVGPDELAALGPREDLLADATAHREAGYSALASIGSDGVLQDLLGKAIEDLDDRSPFIQVQERLRAMQSELTDVGSELRSVAESIDDDPEQLAAVRARRQMLLETIRKYGETLDEVIAYHADARRRLEQLESHDARAGELDGRRISARAALDEVSDKLLKKRRKVAPKLGKAVEAHLQELAMRNARFEVAVDGAAGDDVEFRLAANPGSEPHRLGKVASGGELARTMLALRLVITSAPPTLVFDEVDAGIGGETAHSLGRSLAQLGSDHQVLVVTHLAQVAAYADSQLAVVKSDDGTSTTTTVVDLGDEQRLVELSRMLSGTGSEIAHDHAVELLATASGAKDR